MILSLAVLIGCTGNPPLAAVECASSRGGHFADVPMDLSMGVVSWAYGSGTALEPREVGRTILDCRTGEILRLEVTRNTGPLGTRDVSGEVSAWLWSVPEPARLAQLRKGLAAMGLGLTETFIVAEACACAVFYPGLRGDKPAYEVPA